MSSFVTLLITFIVGSVISTGIVIVLMKVLQKNVTQSVTQKIDSATESLSVVDAGLDAAFARVEAMVSLDQVEELRAELTKLEDKLTNEQERLAKLEASLRKSQSSVDEKEAKHLEIKKGQEDSQQVTDKLRADKETLIQEGERLEGQLRESKEHMEQLSSTFELDDEQKKVISDFTQNLERTQEHMNELMDVHGAAAERFINLQTQYQQLEIEYKNLVEKQLSGEVG